jgi:hypothetical protein
MEPEGSSPCSQKPAIRPYPEPAESVPSLPVSVRSNPMSFFHCLDRAKESVQIRGSLKHLGTIRMFYGEGLLAPCPTPKLEDHSLSAVRDFLFTIFAATLRNRMTSLHPQTEDAPCRGDKEPTQRGF